MVLVVHPKGLESPNYAEFYRCLLAVGPVTLTGVPDYLVEWLRDEASCSDLIWYEGMEEDFLESWTESPELAIQRAYAQYIEAVQSALMELPVCALGEGWLTSPSGQGQLTWEESVRQIGGELGSHQAARMFAAACQKDA